MNTPIFDFVKKYADGGSIRFHMPGHKGKPFLGCEPLDITEIFGADELYSPNGIISESESNLTALFGSGKSCYSTEGSSHTIKAMLCLAMTLSEGRSKKVLAGRNAHKSFIYASALLGFDIEWIYPRETASICSAPITSEDVRKALSSSEELPFCVYLTSPSYLGEIADVEGISRVCKEFGVLLLVDNAHGAYLHFLENKKHPLDLGADICCDSAHKTLPVLTGGAYLHLSSSLPREYFDRAKDCLALFGSTSPSYLILQSLDKCNAYLSDGYKDRLQETVTVAERVKNELAENGWDILPSDPLKLTIASNNEISGHMLMQRLRDRKIHCEYADRDFLVIMASPENANELSLLPKVLGKNAPKKKIGTLPIYERPITAMSVREAVLSRQEAVLTENALGRICASPTVSCPPAIPISVSGEVIGESQIKLFKYYGIERVSVVKL